MNTSIAIGDNGTILKTTDAGNSWIPKTSNTTKKLNRIHFPDANTGYICGTDIVLKTVDGGDNWSVLANINITSPNFNSVFFTNSNTGYISDFSNGMIHKTTDGGSSWSSQQLAPQLGVIFFTDANTGYVSGGISSIFKTTDAGNSWRKQPTQLDNVSAIHFPNSKTGYAVGYKVIKYVLPDEISWTPAIGLNATNIFNPVAKPLVTTTYKATTKTGTCIATDSITVFVNPLTANAGNDKTYTCGNSAQLDSVKSNYTGTGILTYAWLPTKGLNSATIPNPISTETGITYTATITTPNGCIASDQVSVNMIPMNGIEICMVGVGNSKNVLIWNKPVGLGIDAVNIYRETSTSGNFVKIGSVSTDSAGVFIDATSQPIITSNKYKIAILDSCGLETAKSAPHKTMHLTINKGVGITWNLIWEGYEGFSVATYKIYRGTSATNMQLLDAVSGGISQYTDNNPPAGLVYYQLEIINPNPCKTINPITSLRSNVASNNTVGIDEINNLIPLSIYPNPANTIITVAIEKANSNGIILNIYNAMGALVKTASLEQNQTQINVSDLSKGFYTLQIKSINGSGQQKLSIQR